MKLLEKTNLDLYFSNFNKYIWKDKISEKYKLDKENLFLEVYAVNGKQSKGYARNFSILTDEIRVYCILDKENKTHYAIVTNYKSTFKSDNEDVLACGIIDYSLVKDFKNKSYTINGLKYDNETDKITVDFNNDTEILLSIRGTDYSKMNVFEISRNKKDYEKYIYSCSFINIEEDDDNIDDDIEDYEDIEDNDDDYEN